MLVVFNPLETPVQRTIHANLYYTGLVDSAKIREGEGEPREYQLARDYSVDIPVSLPPRGFTWFVIEEPTRE